MRTSNLFSIGLVAALCGLFAFPATAQNIVTDGNFESATAGTYTSGQSIDGGNWFVFANNVSVDNGDQFVLDGQQSVYLNPDAGGTADAIAQFVTTGVGQEYTLSFIANANQTDNEFLAVGEGATTDYFYPTVLPVKPFTGSGTGDYTSYSFNFVASSTSELIVLAAANSALPQGSTELDDVSIVAVPEPGTVALLAGFCLVTACTLSRKRRK